MAASTAPDYTNSRASNSGKFTRIEMVRASTLPERYRTRLAELMEQFNFTGDELWMATESCRRAIGQVCIRRKPGTIVRVRRGREEKCVLGPCDMISRKSVQRLLHELTDVFKVLEVVHDANQWVPHGGDRVFRHSRTYRLRVDQLEPRQTFKEWRIQQKAAHSVTEFPRKPSQPVPPLPPAPAAPLPQRSKPAAAEHEHRSSALTQEKRSPRFATLTRREAPKFVRVFDSLMQPKKIGEAPVETPSSPPPPNNPWSRILARIERVLNPHSFDTWFKPMQFSHESEGVLFVRIPSVEFRHAADKYADLIQESIDELGLGVSDLRFLEPEQKPANTAKFERMGPEQALEKACGLFGISLEHGAEVLKLHRRDEGQGP